MGGRFPAFAVALALAALVLPARASAQGGIEFKAPAEPEGTAIFIRGTGDTRAKGLLELEFWAKEVTDLYGVGFDLRLPHKLFKFPASLPSVVTEGTFLSEDGAVETTLIVKRLSDRTLAVGISRLGQVEGVTGTGHLFTIKLRGLGVSGSKKLRYRNEKAIGSNLEIFEDIVFRSGKATVEAAQAAE